ncbi:MAG TPA: NAD(P)/FAD-dependent oxidoreductase [Planctomycetaceae bacterium]|nr:NAD(P)/FAD-dependent oxidoreductase [Planctomycetaceae bacterium]
MRYDTLIIGAGLSGLAAGIRLAYFGKPVCVLERHTTIGGLNSFYRLRERNYDVGLHAVTNYAPPGTKTGPLSKLLRQLRLSWDDFDLCPQIQSRIAFPQLSLKFNNDIELLLSQVAEKFPGQIDGFRRLVEFLDQQELGRVVDPTLTARPVLAEYLSDKLLVDMLLCPLMYYGSPTPHDIDFTQFVIMFRSIFREGLARPRNGVRVILKRLVRQYKQLGGELRLNSGVRSILADGPRVQGVVLDDGEIIEADRVLSSAGHVETMRLCDGRAAALPPQDDLSQAGEITFVESICTLDRAPAELGFRETAVFYSNAPEFHFANPADACDLSGGIVCSPNNFAYDKPLEEGAVRITALANPSHWMNFAREEDYVAAKAAWHERIVEAALRHIPDFRPAAIDIDMFTPRTIKHFTGHANGCVYGAPRKRWDGTTPFDNLFLCGTDQGFLGIVGAMLSGIAMANRHVLRH